METVDLFVLSVCMLFYYYYYYYYYFIERRRRRRRREENKMEKVHFQEKCRGEGYTSR
jgi:hypothetical protein